jgi:hypothetical protein
MGGEKDWAGAQLSQGVPPPRDQAQRNKGPGGTILIGGLQFLWVEVQRNSEAGGQILAGVI